MLYYIIYDKDHVYIGFTNKKEDADWMVKRYNGYYEVELRR